MNYYAVTVCLKTYNSDIVEILIALFSELPFESFEETEEGFIAYISEPNATPQIDKKVVKLSQKYDFDFTKTFIAYQNWNEIWETHFQPIRIDNFVAVRADFHAITEGVTFELVVNPKMAFGTGHHETTYMMLENMQNIDFHGKKVLDFGAGTGILGILASKMGAAAIEAVDIEEASYENMIENCHMNNVHNMLPIHGVLDDVISTDFDIILANINRNIIIDSLQDLKNRLGTEGRYLLISGFLKQDENVIFQAINYAGFQQMKVSQKGNWLCMLLRN